MQKDEAITKAARPDTTAHPVQAVREYATALEAAMAVALAQPKKPAVHRLRVQTRRLEAQLTLLSQLADVPAPVQETKPLARRLRKLRRAAGSVRDLDVQHDLLTEQPDLPRDAATDLQQHLLQVREGRAARLRQLLFKQLPKIALALEQLIKSLETMQDVTLPEARLVSVIEHWKASQDVNARSAPEQLDDDQLHDARKTAKAARYMAEAAKDSPAAKKAAAIYERQQDAGGQWHDWMALAAAAKDFFGKKHALTLAAVAHRDAARADYLKLLR